jgi:hypothetical protein
MLRRLPEAARKAARHQAFSTDIALITSAIIWSIAFVFRNLACTENLDTGYAESNPHRHRSDLSSDSERADFHAGLSSWDATAMTTSKLIAGLLGPTLIANAVALLLNLATWRGPRGAIPPRSGPDLRGLAPEKWRFPYEMVYEGI